MWKLLISGLVAVAAIACAPMTNAEPCNNQACLQALSPKLVVPTSATGVLMGSMSS